MTLEHTNDGKAMMMKNGKQFRPVDERYCYHNTYTVHKINEFPIYQSPKEFGRQQHV